MKIDENVGAPSPRMIIHLPEGYLNAIGTIVASWGTLEQAVVEGIERMRQIPAHTNSSRLMPRGFAAKADLFGKFAETAFADCPELKDRLIAAIGLGRKISVHRNRLIHGYWLRVGVDDVHLMHDERDVPTNYVVTLADLSELKSQIDECYFLIDLLRHFIPDAAQPLTSEETSALQLFHKNTHLVVRIPSPLEQWPQLLSFRA